MQLQALIVQSPQRKANRTEVPLLEFIPVAVYGRKYLGILFTASSIRGRGTAVFCVVDLKDESKLLALKMSWHDSERVAEQNEVLFERLEESKSENIKLQQSDPRANFVVPIKSFTASRKNETCTTLGAIRAFLDDQLAGFPVENRMLSVSLSGLGRPVKYFWGVHDFVRGVRGAVLGHQYLTSIGVLHRDISESNVVLARRPGEERGYLIDFDMAKLQEPEKPTEATVTTKGRRLIIPAQEMSSSPIPSDETKPIKALRTGTISYMSFNVLYGRRHTHFDDMESFLYVVILFFFSYAGPLSKEELRDADTQGFVQPTGYGRFTHTRSWPDVLATWSDGRTFYHIAQCKNATLGSQAGVSAFLNHPEVKNCLRHNWASGLQDGIDSLFLSLWTLFSDSRVSTGKCLTRTEVTHDDFIWILDEWLAKFHEIEQKFSNCPFT
ncbi:hypothetical protein BDN67DRAFT_1070668 [Paxillus ammoniavirescens]|nr:hypothetical protein BDN67DRAFT_1070668 [Paxillus ammoniavirescens]